MADIISRLKLESGEFDAKIKRAGQELLAYSEHCKKTGLQMGFANKDAVAFAKALGSMQTVSQTARGKINELSEAFVNAKVMYKNMTDAEKNNEFGRNLAASLDQLKARINAAKKDLADVQQELNVSGNKFGQFGSIIDGVGQKMGINANLTELLTSKTALISAGIGAATAVIGKATQEWAKYNAELARQDQITTVTTGLKGPASDMMTDQARALVDTYGADFREVINAANTLMTQFGQTGEQAMKLISDGMQGMIQGDGPKLLSMIQQFAPSFRDAGISASQLVAIIQNSEGGIFTDQNMNAIVMGIKNIRLMTNSTAEALGKLGINGQEMTRKLNDGSLTIFQAMQQVTTAINNAGSSSQAVGEVMQQVFGRQGAAAGAKLGEAIATLNTNLEETKRQTGEVGDSYNRLYEANVKLNKAIRDCFEYDGWEQMATGIKSSLISALAGVIDKLAVIKQFLSGMSANDFFNQMGGDQKVNRMVGRLGNGQGRARETYNQQVGAFEAYINPRKNYLKALDAWRSGPHTDELKAEVEWGRNKFGIDDRAIRNSVKAAELQLEEYQRKAEQVFSSVNKKSEEIKIPEPPTADKKTPKAAETVFPTGSVAEMTKRMQDLQKEQQKVTATEDWQRYQQQIDAVADRINLLKGILPKDKQAVFTITADTKGVSEKLRDIEGVTIDPKAVTVTADTQSALQRIQELVSDIEGTTVELQVKAVPKLEPVDVRSLNMPELTGNPFERMMSQWEQTKRQMQESMNADAMKVDENIFKNVFQTAAQNGINGMDLQFGAISQQLAKGVNIPDSAWKSLIDDINAKLAEMHIDPIKIDFKTGEVKSQAKEMKEDWKDAARAIQSVGSAMASIEDPAAKIVGTVGQAIASIALGFAQATAKDSKLGVFGWIAAVTGGLATMISTISAIHSATGYAEGGIVRGNSYSGDNLMAQGPDGLVGLNAGEVVLTRAMTINLASQLQGQGSGGSYIPSHISGEQIYIAMSRYLKRSGQGEIVTWR